MIALASIAGAVVVAALAHRYGAEDRPVFNERLETHHDARGLI
ncbi:MAG TPA: hypothetical protein VFR97_01565 [Capillimicrobium sp.]|nr:hypothetical protein [Capillimicrobium sp.]